VRFSFDVPRIFSTFFDNLITMSSSSDDIMTDNLAGQLWFGAECLAAGSSILHKETESEQVDPPNGIRSSCMQFLITRIAF
jgi:hypothetical protein